MAQSTFSAKNKATSSFSAKNKATSTLALGHFGQDDLIALTGSFALTGQDVLFPISRQLEAAQGSYTLSGQSVDFPITRTMTAEQGSFTLSGQDVTLTANVSSALSIGTDSRDYSTITLWEADLDDSGVYSASDDAVGEMYNDSAFDESFTIDGGGTIGLNSVTLTVASGERHDGTAGTGARIVRTASGTVAELDVANTSFRWLEIDCQSINYQAVVLCADVQSLHLDHLLVHGFAGSDVWTGDGLRLLNFAGSASNSSFHNSIVYDIEAARTVDNRGVANQFDAFSYYNLTIHAITNTSVNAGIGFRDEGNSVSGQNFQNILVTDCDTCFSLSDADPTRSHNASSDATASGTGSLTSITTSAQYVSTVGGSEDLHLKTGSDCIDAGTDLGTTPSGVEIDIDGNDRDAGGVTWDISAHEFEL